MSIELSYFAVFQMIGESIDFKNMTVLRKRKIGAYCISRMMPYAYDMVMDVNRRLPVSLPADLKFFRAGEKDLLSFMVEEGKKIKSPKTKS